MSLFSLLLHSHYSLQQLSFKSFTYFFPSLKKICNENQICNSFLSFLPSSNSVFLRHSFIVQLLFFRLSSCIFKNVHAIFFPLFFFLFLSSFQSGSIFFLISLCTLKSHLISLPCITKFNHFIYFFPHKHNLYTPFTNKKK